MVELLGGKDREGEGGVGREREEGGEGSSQPIFQCSVRYQSCSTSDYVMNSWIVCSNKEWSFLYPSFSEFLQRGATSEVNVSANVQEVVEKDLQTPSRYAFTAAQVNSHRLCFNSFWGVGVLCAENVDWVGRVGMPSKSS